MHEPERRRRLSLPPARAAPPASSRTFPQPGPLPRSPSSSSSRCVGCRHFRISLVGERNRTAKIDGPITFGYGIDAIGSTCKNQGCVCFSRQRAGRYNDDHHPRLEKISTEGDSSAAEIFVES